MYIDEIRRLQDRVKMYETPLPISCQSGHTLKLMKGNYLQCKYCHFIPFAKFEADEE